MALNKATLCSAPFLLKLIALICCIFGGILLNLQERKYFDFFLLYYNNGRASNELMVFSLTGYIMILSVLIVAMVETGLNDVMCLLFLVIGALFNLICAILGIMHYIHVKNQAHYVGYVLETALFALATGICLAIDFVLQAINTFK